MGRPCLRDEDIVRADITVQKIVVMNDSEGFHHRKQKVSGLFEGELAAFGGGISHEIDTIDILHDEVRGTVLSEEIVHGNDIRDLTELGEDPGLVEELRRAGIELRLLVLGAYSHRVVVVITDRDTGRQIFFYGNGRLQRHIHRQIGNAKSTYTQYSSRQITSIQDRSDR